MTEVAWKQSCRSWMSLRRSKQRSGVLSADWEAQAVGVHLRNVQGSPVKSSPTPTSLVQGEQ